MSLKFTSYNIFNSNIIILLNYLINCMFNYISGIVKGSSD